MTVSSKQLQQICSLELRLLQPSVRCSEKELNELIADDFIEIGSSGRIYDKTSAIQAVLSNDHEDLSENYNLNAKQLGSELVLIEYTTRNGEIQRSSVWQHKDQNWVILFHQAVKT